MGIGGQELVIIGIDLRRETIVQAFAHCLLTDAEMTLGWQQWRTFDDPFMPWIETALQGETR